MDCTSPKPSKSDKSDQKASLALIETLSKLSNQSEQKSPKSTKPTKDHQSPGTSKPRKRTLIVDDKYPKITEWLSKENLCGKRKKKEEKRKPLDITVTKEKNSATDGTKVKKSPKKEKKSKSLKRSSSFEKYGVALPSFEKILADRKKFQQHKESVKQLDVFDEELLNRKLDLDCLQEKETFTGELLDCRHLTQDQLSQSFRKHLLTVKEIMSGNEYSDRHERFHSVEPLDSITKDLRCSDSLVVFTQEQKEHLLDLLQEELDPDNKLISYFFKVLLPELCLLIFMDEHSMSKKKAAKYLANRPLDI